MQESVDALKAELDIELKQIEQRLHKTVVSDSPFMEEAGNHLIKAGGKRFRPSLLALCSHFGNETDQEKLISAAVAVELTHVASLYHDDVMDDAQVRRGAPSANAKYGNTVAILMGDYIFAAASTEVAKLGPEYVTVQAHTFQELVTGQIMETLGPQQGMDPIEHHFKVLDGKTASLIRTACVFGAMVGGCQTETIDALRNYGTEIGMIFQLSDDLIDITSDETGKTPGTDLREGVPTLPVLLLQKSTDPADQELAKRISGDLSDDEVLAEALAELRANPVIDKARAEIEARAQKARETIKELPDNAAKQILLELCDVVVNRSK